VRGYGPLVENPTITAPIGPVSRSAVDRLDFTTPISILGCLSSYAVNDGFPPTAADFRTTQDGPPSTPSRPPGADTKPQILPATAERTASKIGVVNITVAKMMPSAVPLALGASAVAKAGQTARLLRLRSKSDRDGLASRFPIALL